jgi:hypothetical protein
VDGPVGLGEEGADGGAELGELGAVVGEEE